MPVVIATACQMASPTPWRFSTLSLSRPSLMLTIGKGTSRARSFAIPPRVISTPATTWPTASRWPVISASNS